MNYPTTYKMRNLPCRDAAGDDMPYAVCGNMRNVFDDGVIIHSGGVLEWCWDEQDALHRLEMMRRDKRFSNLTIQRA